MKNVSATTSSKLDAELVEKAVNALLKHHQRTDDASEKKQLLGTDVPVQVLLGLEVAPKDPIVKPIRLAIPHPLHQLSDVGDVTDLDEAEVCLIVKEESKPAIQEQIASFPEHLRCVKKVLGLQSLRTKHASYQQRRDLLARFNVFMADDRILPMLQSALGKDFVRAKKLPIPVRLTRKEALPFAIQKALSSTYLHVPRGTCVLVKVGSTNMPTKALVENILAACDAAVPHVPRKWANIRSISIKLPASQSLPVYNKTPTQLQEIAQMAGLSLPGSDGLVDETTVKKVDASDGATIQQIQDKKSKDKSPLLRAVKKQEKLDNSATKKSGETDVAERKEDNAERSQKKRDRKQAEKKLDDKEPKSSGKVTKKNKSEDASSSTQVAEVPSPSPAKKQKKSVEPLSKPEEFVAAKKFQGSKRGFVFKKDKHGLGYYLDRPPIPDKMALEALKRTTQNKGKRGTSKNKGKHGRR